MIFASGLVRNIDGGQAGNNLTAETILNVGVQVGGDGSELHVHKDRSHLRFDVSQ